MAHHVRLNATTDHRSRSVDGWMWAEAHVHNAARWLPDTATTMSFDDSWWASSSG
jgi:hypothetical protein